jgi:nitrogenase iron protein NifH
MKKIAIYGKGGSGKTTITSNLAFAFAKRSFKVTVIGCDPKCDTCLYTVGRILPNVLDNYEAVAQSPSNDRTWFVANHRGVKCIEIGGPKPGIGCGGAGVLLGLELLIEKLDLLWDEDIVLFDLPGDIPCGGFATPLRKGYADKIFILTTDETSSLYATNTLCEGLRNIRHPLNGIIANSRSSYEGDGIIEDFCRRIGIALIGRIPYDREVQTAERSFQPELLLNPESRFSTSIDDLSDRILATFSARNSGAVDPIPEPLSFEEISRLLVPGNPN